MKVLLYQGVSKKNVQVSKRFADLGQLWVSPKIRLIEREAHEKYQFVLDVFYGRFNRRFII